MKTQFSSPIFVKWLVAYLTVNQFQFNQQNAVQLSLNVLINQFINSMQYFEIKNVNQNIFKIEQKQLFNTIYKYSRLVEYLDIPLQLRLNQKKFLNFSNFESIINNSFYNETNYSNFIGSQKGWCLERLFLNYMNDSTAIE